MQEQLADAAQPGSQLQEGPPAAFSSQNHPLGQKEPPHRKQVPSLQ